MKRVLLIFLFIFSFSCQAAELYPLDSAEQDQLFKKLLSNFRCLVCQNQNLLDSHATLAEDLRLEIYRSVKEGKTEAEIQAYLLNRYGDFVLYQPPLSAKTIVLWMGPFAGLMLAVVLLILMIHRQNRVMAP